MHHPLKNICNDDADNSNTNSAPDSDARGDDIIKQHLNGHFLAILPSLTFSRRKPDSVNLSDLIPLHGRQRSTRLEM